MSFKILAISLISLSAFSGKCYKYKCDTSIGACAMILNDTLVLNKNFCEQDQYCHTDFDFNSHCRAIYDYARLPGRKCDCNNQCYSFECIDGVCAGLKEGISCFSHNSCDIGLYCHEYEGTCMKLKTKDEYCEYSSMCDYELVCINQNCKEYYSVKNSEKIDDSLCDRSRSMACESGQCYYDYYYDDYDEYYYRYTICIEGSKYEKEIIPCNDTDDCWSKSGDFLINNGCNCGMNSEGNSYCEVTQGSIYGKWYTEFLKKYVTSFTIRKAHKNEKFTNSIKDWADEVTYSIFLEKYFWATYGHYAINGLDCAKEMFFYKLNDYEISLGSILSLGLALIAYN